MKKKTLALTIFSVGTCLSLLACGNKKEEEKLPFNYEPDFSYVDASKLEGKTLKVGAILIGDETEGYSQAHIDGINTAASLLREKGATVEVTYEKKVGDGDTSTVKSKVEGLVGAGNNIVITNSYGHQNAFAEGQFDVTTAPEVDFIAMTGDTACLSQASNFHNAFNATYQSRYMAGYVAGLKLAELDKTKLPASSFDKDGNIKIGYVGAFNYAEVVSGYTGFFLGIKAAYPNVSMTVKYTDSWWDDKLEKSTASDLISQGCVVISQHADSTGAPAACQTAWDEGKTVYNVGYNVSMLEAAPDCSLTSATNNWAVYYTNAFYKKLIGEPIEKEWAKGYEAGAVAITEINYDCFETSQDELVNKLSAVASTLHDGTKKVFDASTWTVKGEHLTTYTITDDWSTVKGAQCMKTVNGVTYFDESNASEIRCAPYFDVRIDGISEVAKD